MSNFENYLPFRLKTFPTFPTPDWRDISTYGRGFFCGGGANDGGKLCFLKRQGLHFFIAGKNLRAYSPPLLRRQLRNVF